MALLINLKLINKTEVIWQIRRECLKNQKNDST